jgi:hypothetical protein
MEHAVANPVGGALGQLISPLSGTTKQSVSMMTISSDVHLYFLDSCSWYRFHLCYSVGFFRSQRSAYSSQ